MDHVVGVSAFLSGWPVHRTELAVLRAWGQGQRHFKSFTSFYFIHSFVMKSQLNLFFLIWIIMQCCFDAQHGFHAAA